MLNMTVYCVKGYHPHATTPYNLKYTGARLSAFNYAHEAWEKCAPDMQIVVQRVRLNIRTETMIAALEGRLDEMVGYVEDIRVWNAANPTGLVVSP